MARTFFRPPPPFFSLNIFYFFWRDGGGVDDVVGGLRGGGFRILFADTGSEDPPWRAPVLFFRFKPKTAKSLL